VCALSLVPPRCRLPLAAAVVVAVAAAASGRPLWAGLPVAAACFSPLPCACGLFFLRRVPLRVVACARWGVGLSAVAFSRRRLCWRQPPPALSASKRGRKEAASISERIR